MVGALWIDSGSDSDSDATSGKQRRNRHRRSASAVGGPSRLSAAPPSSSSSVIVLSSSQDHGQLVAAKVQRHGKAVVGTLGSHARLMDAHESVQATPAQRLAQLLADNSPDTSLPSFGDLLRQHKSRRDAAASAHACVPSGQGSTSICASRPTSTALPAGSLRRTVSQPIASSSQDNPTSSRFRPSVRRPTKYAGADATAPEVIEIGSDSIVDSASEADAEHVLYTSSPIRSQRSLRTQQPSSQPLVFSPPSRVSAAKGRSGEARRTRPNLRADSAPIVILSSSPPPPSLPSTSQSSSGHAVGYIAEEECMLPNFPSSSLPFEDPPPSPPSTPVGAPAAEAFDASPSLKRRGVHSDSKPTTPKRPRPISRTGSLLEALDKLYAADDMAMMDQDQAENSADGDRVLGIFSAVTAPDLTRKENSSAQLSPSKAQRSAAAKEAREAKAREREAVKLAKAQAAAEKKRFLEANRLRTSKADTMRELIIDLDRTLFSAGQPFAGYQESIQARFEQEGASVHLCDAVVAPPLVRFRRKVKAEWNNERRHWVPLNREQVRREPMVIVYIDAKQIVQLVAEGGEQGLESWYGDLERRLSAADGGRERGDGQQRQVFLVCQGLIKYYARLRASENRAYTARIRQQLAESQPADQATSTASDAVPKSAPRRANTAIGSNNHSSSSSGGGGVPAQSIVERSLLQLKLVHRCYVIHAASLVDGIEWLHQLTSDLSLKPYKSLRDSHLSFAVDTGRNTTSCCSAAIYALMLEQIPRVTPAISQSITTIYPSLHALLRAYQSCNDESEQRAMLSSIQVVSNRDGTERRANRTNLGLQLSKRIHAVIRGTNADLLINKPTKD